MESGVWSFHFLSQIMRVLIDVLNWSVHTYLYKTSKIHEHTPWPFIDVLNVIPKGTK